MTMYALNNDAAGLVGADGGGTGVALMTSDLDNYRSANVLIHEHGQDAMRANAVLEKGDLAIC